MQPDYSRQILLKEIGEQGQAALARGRVLVVGAGGLGSPTLQYLAGAGVGCLGIVDADTLDASNLHRQPIFALADAGRQTAQLAAAAVPRIHPAVRVELHALRLRPPPPRASFRTRASCTSTSQIRATPACAAYGPMRSRTAWSATVRKRACWAR